MTQRSSTSRSSYARPLQVSPTTCTVCGAQRFDSAHASRKVETDWWNSSSGGSEGRSAKWSMRPREIASKIASPVSESPSWPHPMSSTRWACGNRLRTSASRTVPGTPASSSPASTRATSSPAAATSSSVASAARDELRQRTR